MVTKVRNKKRKYAVSMKVVRLVQKVQKHILEEPRRFDMNLVALKKDMDTLEPYEKKLQPPCGTTACIAGWVALVTTPKIKWKQRGYYYSGGEYEPSQDLTEVARKHLGLERGTTEETGVSKNGLCRAWDIFDQYSWPEPFKTKFAKLEDANYGTESLPVKRKLAKIAVKRLDHFLVTGL